MQSTETRTIRRRATLLLFPTLKSRTQTRPRRIESSFGCSTTVYIVCDTSWLDAVSLWHQIRESIFVKQWSESSVFFAIFTNSHFALHFPRCNAAVTTTLRHFRLRGAVTPAKELGQPSVGNSLWSFLLWNISHPLFQRETGLILFSDAYYLAGANELFQCGPGLKCHISCRIFLLAANKLAECKQQGTVIGQASS